MHRLSIQLGIISFTTGFGLMVFELVAARILAPKLGNSSYVWTSVIGVIVLALSAGYYFGGKIADKRKNPNDVVVLLFLTAISIVLTKLTHLNILESISTTTLDSRLKATLAALILFAPASLFLGIISPYLAKLNITSLEKSGKSVADLSVLNAIGSIVGTFLTGFVIFQFVGSNQTMIFVILMILASAWILQPKTKILPKIIATLIITLLSLIPATQRPNITDIDTPSSHYQIIKTSNRQGEDIRLLATGPRGAQSGINIDNPDDLIFWYTQKMADFTLKSNPENVLLLGGGAFTLPNYLVKESPSMKIDVVEIDSSLESISKEHFLYKDSPNVNLFFDDARSFLNQNKKKYDLILVDVYGDIAIPFQLSTIEYSDKIRQSLKEDGMVVANIVSAVSGRCSSTFWNLNSAYLQNFKYGYFIKELPNKDKISNIVATFANNKLDGYGEKIQKTNKAPLTDNFAPTEFAYAKC